MQFAKSVKLETVLTFDILEEDDGVKRLFTTIVDDVNHLLPALFLHRKKKTYTGNTKMNRKRKYSMVQKRALSNLNTLEVASRSVQFQNSTRVGGLHVKTLCHLD